MKTKQIKNVSIFEAGNKLNAHVLPVPGAREDLEFAFYVFRNDERVHVAWYTTSTCFEYDTGGIPGYYRVAAFAKGADGVVEAAKSAPLFVSPVVVNEAQFAAADPDKVAYLLKGAHWEVAAMYIPAAAKRLFVMMPSAVKRDLVTLPCFSRWTWAFKGVFPGHVLCLADPTLNAHPELGLGWFLGNHEHCATDEIAGFVTQLAASKGIAREDIFIWGSSAGGFAALALAAKIPGATAVAINAQTDAFAYQVQDQVALLSQWCFGSDAVKQVREQFLDRLDMTVRWASKPASRVVMVQNALDLHHYNVHYKPFWTALGGVLQEGWTSAGPHKSWVYKDQGGHVPETIEMVGQIVSILTDEPRNATVGVAATLEDE